MASTTNGTCSISAARLKAAKLTQGSVERAVAEFRADVLAHILACQELRDTGLSAECAQIAALKDGVANPNRPFLNWECCDEHRALKATREGLRKRAADLGIEASFDITQFIVA